MATFTHLHTHSHFSFGSGVSSPAVLLEAARARGFTALACTDTNGVYGAIEFQQAAESMGIRPILGAHLVANGQEAVALAADEQGWAALCRAITAIHWTTEPIHLAGLLAPDRRGLILLSNSLAFLEQVRDLSGPADLYAELRPGKERHAVLAAARRLGLSAVVTGGVTFAHPEDWSRHRLRVAIARNTTLSALEESGREAAEPSSPSPPHSTLSTQHSVPSTQHSVPSTQHSVPSTQHSVLSTQYCLSPRDAWLRPAAELSRFFPDCPEGLRTAEEIAERCRYRIPIGRTVAPRIASAGESFARLRAAVYEGATRRYGTIAPFVRERLEHELAIIGMKEFADYFLVVQDIVRGGATERGPIHCGRGSVANSVVSYCLGITHVEPLSAGLLFERFLNPERRDPPDIDLDFPWDERDHVLAYVFQKYPHPRAAMVANHNCFRLRGALREVAKVHGRPPGEIREITRRFPWFSEDESLADLLATHPNFKGLQLPDVWRSLAEQAQPLVGVPRHLSLHPGGVVIVPTALTDYVPVERGVKVLAGYPDLTVPVIQFEKDGAEDAGLVKIDLLGNRSLAVIRDAIASVRTRTGHQIDYTTADPEDDEPTRALFRSGRTMGVFYTESPASRLLCAKSKADTFELLVLNTSIIRPASNRFIRVYLERLHGKPYEPLDPSLRDTLASTFGVMVYQEDVVNVASVFAGMPLATGDGLRKALSKKRPVKQLVAYAEEFFAGADRLRRDPETAKRVWEMIMSFAGYSFCKGHSCSYIRVAQHSCYLRAHHPAHFMAAVLANGGGFYHPFAYVAEAMRMGLTVHPPDVNASAYRCEGHDREVRIGLQFIKGLSADGCRRLLEARDGSGRPVRQFTSLADLRHRARLSADDLRTLIKVGACDTIAGEWTRPMLLWMVDAESVGAKERRNGDQMESWLDRDTGELAAEVERSVEIVPAQRPAQSADEHYLAVPMLREYPAERRRREEFAALGFTTDCHPMDLYAEELRRFRICRTPELHRHVGKTVLLAGMLTTAKPVHTVTDEPMEFATFDDGEGLVEAVLFPEIYRARGHVLFDQGPFIFRGRVEEEFGAITVTLTHLDRLERMLDKLGARRPGR